MAAWGILVELELFCILNVGVCMGTTEKITLYRIRHTDMHKWIHIKHVNVNILIMICKIIKLEFCKCCHWGKLRKVCKSSVCIISYNCLWFYNYLNLKESCFTHREQCQQGEKVESGISGCVCTRNSPCPILKDLHRDLSLPSLQIRKANRRNVQSSTAVGTFFFLSRK